MRLKVTMALAVLLASISCVAQVQPTAGKVSPWHLSAGGGMNYWSGDWQRGDINRWGPAIWGNATIWHCLGLNAEGHSMFIGGNKAASHYKLFIAEGGLMCTMGYWGRLQPIYMGDVGFASLTQPGNGTGHFHSSYATWSAAVGLEYHTAGHWWTRAYYTYQGIPDFHSSVTNQSHTLNPRGVTIGVTYRFGAAGTRF